MAETGMKFGTSLIALFAVVAFLVAVICVLAGEQQGLNERNYGDVHVHDNLKVDGETNLTGDLKVSGTISQTGQVQESTASLVVATTDNGKLFVLNNATPTVYVPTPVKGVKYEFFASLTLTGGAISINPGGGATGLFIGSLLATGDDAGVTGSARSYKSTEADGHNTITFGTTEGGLIGSRLSLTGISDSQYAVEGNLIVDNVSGSSDPFS